MIQCNNNMPNQHGSCGQRKDWRCQRFHSIVSLTEFLGFFEKEFEFEDKTLISRH